MVQAVARACIVADYACDVSEIELYVCAPDQLKREEYQYMSDYYE